ncbi:molybdenum ABC transporter ATP-binding protein [Endozoicomonas euniceicola]|uniref:Molybdenum ABC transporter ATP-binding protein n=1 Tax=Endozoicomonas euniceicola TaxID=1234143 RepID=A0ABY6GQZ0_9GAMM|nr:molybdenum ABC transporter ATP-binding protein [Endozoicomonas euniceicola]UYM15172.1 molybdenum ABC transporter ATP-binding protein [Endozoicomonas euniceicola]
MDNNILQFTLDLPRDHFHISLDQSLALDGIWGVMGSSGCGKTSLLRCLAGLETGVQGRIICNGRTWLDSEQGIFLPPEQRGIGYIFQEARLFPHLNVTGNLQFARKRANPNQAALSFADIIQQMGIGHLLERTVDKLSGGEKQRVAIARTLLNAPSLLLMDEPLASLDWPSRLSIMPCLKQIQREFKIPVVFVSHSKEEVARLADSLLLMHQGQVIEKGICRHLLNRLEEQDNSDQPLSALDATVLKHDPHYGLTTIQVDQHRLYAGQLNSRPTGTPVRVVVPASEISLTLEPLQASSIQNCIPVHIASLQKQGHHHVLLSLSLGEQELICQITRKSFDTLQLSAGNTVFACFKASGLEVL